MVIVAFAASDVYHERHFFDVDDVFDVVESFEVGGDEMVVGHKGISVDWKCEELVK